MKKNIKIIPIISSLLVVTPTTAIIASCSCASKAIYYNVYFDDKYGIGDLESLNVPANSKISDPGARYAIGREFMGWYKESTYQNKWDFDKDVVTSDTTLHAKWRDTGASVDKSQWDSAFEIIGDRTKEQHFWYDGTISETIYDDSGNVVQEIVLTDLIFNGSKQWCRATEKTSSSAKIVDVAAEYYSNFFFQAKQETETTGAKTSYSYADNTDATRLNEYVMQQSKYAGPEGTTCSTIYKKIGGAYVYAVTENTGYCLMSRLNFAENKLDPSVMQLENMYFFEYNPTTKTEVLFDVAINYEDKEIELPENWDEYKEAGHAVLQSGTSSVTISQSEKISSGYIVSDIEGSHEGVKQIKFELDKTGSGLYPSFTNSDVILYVNGKYFPITTDSYKNGIWTLPDEAIILAGSSLSLLINNMPNSRSLHIELIK